MTSVLSIATHRPPQLRYSTLSRQLQRQSTYVHPTNRAFSSALIPLQTLTASRILPYHAHEIFDIIADIEAYPSFIPYLQSSNITSKSSPDPTQKRQWPRIASLHVGYGPYNESFTSRVYCVPYTVLEAVAGEAEATIPTENLPHYFSRNELYQAPPAEAKGDLFTSLLTRWTFREYPFKPNPLGGNPQEGNANERPSSPRTEVNLHIEIKFASAVYAALSQAAAPKVAGMMVDAFEKRAREVLGEGRGEVSASEVDADKKSALFGAGAGGMKT